MDKQKPPYHWTTQQLSDGCQISECPDYDNYKDFKRDPTGYYVLIKINFELSRVEVGICDKDHKIVGIFRGRKSQDIYNAIFKREKKYRSRVVSGKNAYRLFRERTEKGGTGPCHGPFIIFSRVRSLH
jgi:hypothetical protein